MKWILPVNVLVVCLAALAQADQLRGRVVNPNGSPAGGASVSVAFGQGPNLRSPEEITADGQGQFAVDLNGESGQVGLRARLRSLATAKATIVQLPWNQPVTLKLANNALGWVRGRVVDASGRPIADADVTLMMRLSPNPFGMRNDAGTSDGAGRFLVQSLWPDGNYTLAVSKAGFGMERRPLRVSLGAKVSLSDITLRRRDSSIAGALLNRAGVPLADHRVVVFGPETGMDQVTTDGARRFRDEVMSGEQLNLFVVPTTPGAGWNMQTTSAGYQNVVLHDNSAPVGAGQKSLPPVNVAATGVLAVWNYIYVILGISGTLIAALFIGAIVQNRKQRQIRAPRQPEEIAR